jgi:hypothetical protein
MEEKKEVREKMSYEQLENVAHQLSEQSRQLYTKLQEANMTNMFKRLDYLFKVVENNAAFESEFVKKCSNEIVDLLTIPEEPELNSEEDNK